MEGSKRLSRVNHRRNRKRASVDVSKSAFHDTLWRFLAKFRNGIGMIVFSAAACFYLTNFYELSPHRSGKTYGLSLSKPGLKVGNKSPVSELSSQIRTVVELPGAIKSSGGTFDTFSNEGLPENNNKLPGAIGLSGPFDTMSAEKVNSNLNVYSTGKNVADALTLSTPLAGNKKRDKTRGNHDSERASTAASQAVLNEHRIDRAPSSEKATASLATRKASNNDGQQRKPLGSKRKRKKKKAVAMKSTKGKAKKEKLTSRKVKKRNSKKEQVPPNEGKGKGKKINSPSAGGSQPARQTSKPKTMKKKKRSIALENGSRQQQRAKSDGYPHPMNRQMKELQVEGGTGSLGSKELKSAYGKLARAYLAPFAGGIERGLFFDVLRRKTYALAPPGANKGAQTILFQIIGAKLFMMDPYEVTRNAKPFYRSRIKELIWLLSKVAKKGNVPDTEFLLAVHDCVQTVNSEHSYRGASFVESNPTFTIVSCNFSDNIPFPMWEGDSVRGGLKNWDKKMDAYRKDDVVPWAEKTQRAVFRGGNRPSMYYRNKADADDHCDDTGRTRLLHLGKANEELFDVEISGTCGGTTHRLTRLSEAEHHKYKYILYAEGNCFWADRLNKQIFGPSAIVKQETPCGQFWEPLLKPMTHYIPTDFYFSNTVDQIKWAKNNDDAVRKIVENANEFASNFLKLRGVVTYVEVLLTEYSKLLVTKEIRREKGGEDVTM